MSGVGLEPTNLYGLVLKTNCAVADPGGAKGAMAPPAL